MACGTCGSGKSVGTIQQPRLNKRVVESDEECIYKMDVLRNWETRFECIKANNTYHLIGSSEAEINGFLGVVQSAMKNPATICYFAPHLSTISLTIVKIINSGQC